MSEDLLKYKKLTDVEHVLTRAGMYLGSITQAETTGYILNSDHSKMILKTYEYNPALVKLFDEIISNSVDEHIRSGNVTTIHVTLDKLTGEMSVLDNGGIPVSKHPEYNEYIPTMIFSELRAGSNFDDTEGRVTGGLNGLGSTLVNIFSKEFKVMTADGKNSFVQTFKNNMSSKSRPTIQSSDKRGTKITFTPDYNRLGCTLDNGSYDRIVKRVYDVAGCNPKIKVYLNDQLIKINKFKDYVNLYVDEFVEEQSDSWYVAVAASDNDTFSQVSFVNGIDTYNGGSHVDYVANQIVNKLREYIKKKHKIDLKPNNIKQQLFLFVNCVIKNPIFTSQTKECMSSDPKDFGTSYEVSDKLINSLIKSDIVQKILDWAEAQQRQKELAELRKLNKTTQNTNFLKKIIKFDDASSKDRMKCTLVLSEGDSAKNAIMSARDPNIIGAFPLRGKPLNVRDIKVQKLTNNEEIANIMAILGLKIGEDHELEDLRFGKLLIASDADCMDSYTEIVTSRGNVAIKDILPTDLVLSSNGKWNYVEELIQVFKESFIEISISNCDKVFRFGKTHQLLKSNRTWAYAEELKVGDFIKGTDLSYQVASVKEINESITMYDMTVSGDHTFVVSTGASCKENIISHNCDGHHIAGLMVNLFSQLWPNLIKKGLLYRLKTPVIVATHGKSFTEFFSRREYNEWVNQNPTIKHSFKWYKGLGSWSTKDFKRFMTDQKYHEPLVYNDQSDFDCIDLAFDRTKADERKEWLAKSN